MMAVFEATGRAWAAASMWMREWGREWEMHAIILPENVFKPGMQARKTIFFFMYKPLGEVMFQA